MVQIKLSIAFVLAAAAIAPIVALPTPPRPHGNKEFREGEQRERHIEGERKRDHRLFREGEERERHIEREHRPRYDAPARREFVDFEVRDYASEQKLYTSLEAKVAGLKKQDNKLLDQEHHLEDKDRHLRHEEHHLEDKDGHLRHEEHHLEDTNRGLRHTEHKLEGVDSKLLGEKHHLEGDVTRLGRKRDDLDRSIGSKIRASTRKNEVLGIKNGSPSLLRGPKGAEIKLAELKRKEGKLEALDQSLAAKGRVLKHKNSEERAEGRKLEGHNEVLTHEGHVLAHHDDALKGEGRKLEAHNEVLGHERRVLTHEDNVLKGEKKALKSTIASEKETIATEKKSTTSPVVRPKAKLSAREYVDDLFERDFDEVEFDTRYFDDELYLD